MRLSTIPLAAALLLFVALAHADASQPAASDRAVVTRRRIVLVRTGRLARQFPERRRAVVHLPVVSGIADARVLRKVRATLDLKNVFDSTLAEYRQDAWLEEIDFKVNYNKHHLLDITIWQTGTGAYPDSQQEHYTFDLRTGDVLKAKDVFAAGALGALAAMADGRLREEVREIVAAVEQDQGIASEERPSLKESLAGLSFGVEHLDNFVVSDRGLTFLYDAGFPHVIKALEPAGEYFFTYAQLAPYIRRDGPLGRFVK